MKKTVALVFALLALASAASAQTAPKNPTSVSFTVSADHDRTSSYELDIVRASDKAVIQTLNIGKPTPDAVGTAVSTISVQPIAFGTYYGVLRAIAGTLVSPDSLPSNQFTRSPGAPSKVVF